MDPNRYTEQLNADIYYYTYVHCKPPEKIFMSHHLLSALVSDDNAPIYHDLINTLTYCGIPVQVYMSGKLEYYFASYGYMFEAED